MKKVIIVGGGSSVKEGIEKGLWYKIKGNEIWSLNFAYKFMPYLPTRELWIDTSFFTNNIDDLKNLHENGVKLITKKHGKYATFPEISQYEATRNHAEYPPKMFLGKVGLVGFFALSLALVQEFTEIYLLGYDFGNSGLSNRDTHFYQDKVTEMKIQSSGVGRPSVYRREDNNVKDGVNDFDVFKSPNIKIYNVSPQSNIRSFEKIAYDEFFAKICNSDFQI